MRRKQGPAMVGGHVALLRLGQVFLYVVCVRLWAALCRGMHKRTGGDPVRSSCYQDHSSVCTVGVPALTGLSWVERSDVNESVCVWGSVLACITGLGATWKGVGGAGPLAAVPWASWLWFHSCLFWPHLAVVSNYPTLMWHFPRPVCSDGKTVGREGEHILHKQPYLCSHTYSDYNRKQRLSRRGKLLRPTIS